MPTYVYEVILPDDEEGQLFEVVQRITDPPLTHHPMTGLPVRRVIQAPHVGGAWSSAREKRVVSDDHAAQHGFAKYEKTNEGVYEKRAGKGPRTIRRP